MGLPSRRERSGLVLADPIACVLVLALAIAAIVLMADRARLLARIGEDLSHLRTIHGSTVSYAADFEDRAWQLSWRAWQVHWSPDDPAAIGFVPVATDAQSALQQLTYIIRTRGERPEAPNFAGVNLWPYLSYSHLALQDYLGDALPTRLFVSAADRRRAWADDPRGYDAGLYSPNLGVGGYNIRHPYGASFRMGTCFFDNAPVGSRVSPMSTSSVILPTTPSGTISGRPLSDIAHPSQKAFLHDLVARHFGPQQVYHAFPEARLPVLMADGSARVRSFAEANPGADPNNPAGPAPSLTYTPLPIEPPATGPNAGPARPGPQWTRMGLLGRDFGGPEVYPPP